MPVTVTCKCGVSYTLKDEFAGKTVKCPQCGETIMVPGGAAPGTDSAFDRDKFLLRQKHLALTAEKYYVWDETGKVILFVERPYHTWRSLLALMAGCGTLLVVMAVFIVAAVLIGTEVLGIVLGIVGFLIGISAAIAIAIVLSEKRHVTFYRDDSKKEQLLSVLQLAKIQIPTATYHVKDAQGNLLAVLRKNYLYDFFRKRWQCCGPDGKIVCIANEDSLILALLRRWLGPMFGLLRTNFIIHTTDGRLLGEFNRQFTILDRYVLDMSSDPAKEIDRRVALALGVMLDTGERR